MAQNPEHTPFDLNWSDTDFKHYRIRVKILKLEKIENQDLDIFTTSLGLLLEMRRLHNKIFSGRAFESIFESTRNN